MKLAGKAFQELKKFEKRAQAIGAPKDAKVVSEETGGKYYAFSEEPAPDGKKPPAPEKK